MGYALSDDCRGTKQEIIHIVGQDTVYHTNTIEICKFSFGFSWSLTNIHGQDGLAERIATNRPPLKSKRLDDRLHTWEKFMT